MVNEAIDELKKYTLGKKDSEKVEISVLALNRIIFALEEEPKVGHWVEYKPDYHRCSNCNKDALVKWHASKRDNVDILTNFCPNCGARMIES